MWVRGIYHLISRFFCNTISKKIAPWKAWTGWFSPIISKRSLCLNAFRALYICRSQILNRNHIHILKQNHLFQPFIFFQGLNRRISPLKWIFSLVLKIQIKMNKLFIPIFCSTTARNDLSQCIIQPLESCKHLVQ